MSHMMFLRTRGSPPVSLNFLTPRRMKAVHEPVELFERQELASSAGTSYARTCNRRSGSRNGR